ncbi:MAG: tRNA (adenosine(37)-N6)-dimethylallyltransferase MiaA [Candidatus Omnitrophica bacterium CG_4_10_14_0_8_um_filter_43_18]|nr:MAG: tRNA (adenosine(37)-N6)-dimethylallyltransferase MiaA [Candidatus Omnitrophica bacterium CG_4_10_14_0_8_um_filter_43_18]
MPMKKAKVIFLVGPTGAGKTAVSVKLAKKIKGEIICCDSMQIYKGMDILTAQPSKKEKAAIRHHLFCIRKPSEPFSVAEYRKLALKKIDVIHRNGRVPVFTGGTGLYAQAVLDGLFSSPVEDLVLRKKLYAYAKKYGSRRLHERLKKIDPAASRKIHPNDIRRVVRAFEVYKTTGSTISDLKSAATSGGVRAKYKCRIVCLFYKNRQAQYKKINDRVEEMFKSGLVDEVKRLLKVKLSKTASCALGIKQVKGLINGVYSLHDTKELLKRDTRRYAKRQISWFKRDKAIKPVAIDSQNIKKILDSVLALI